MMAEQVDVLIITALQSELSAVLALGEKGEKGWTETRDRSGMPYHLREFSNKRGKRFVIAAAWSVGHGAASVTLRTERLIAELDPSCLAMCGVCAGKRGTVFLGDVIVADRIFGFDVRNASSSDERTHRAIIPHSVPTYNLEGTWRLDASYLAIAFEQSAWARTHSSIRPSSLDAQERWLLHTLYDFELGQGVSPVAHSERSRYCPDWRQVLQKLRDSSDLDATPGVFSLTRYGRSRVEEERLQYPDGLPEDPPFRVHVGTLATTTNPINDPLIFNLLNEYQHRTIGVEMEASAIARIAVSQGRRAIIIKAVADYADHSKEDRFLKFACHASAEFLLFFLQDRFEPETRRVRTTAATLKSVSLDRIVIRDFKNIQHLELPLATVSELPGHWTCIAGLNGAGKSAVLQAIALILLGERLSPVIGDEWLKRARRVEDGKPLSSEIRAWVRDGQELLEIALHIGVSGINFSRQETEPACDAMRKFWDNRERNHLLLSYGAGRNLSEYQDNRHATKSEDVRRQMTLFDPLTQVLGVEVLLSRVERAKPVLTMIKRLLDSVFQGEGFFVENENDTLRFQMGGATVSATELPDGFRSTVAWLADLCIAWCEKMPEEAQDGDPSKICAIVLIDEIDLHLHAALQRILVPRLRKALPNVQWVVTTHSPLVVSSFDSRELVMLDTSQEGPMQRELDRQVLAFSTDEVYSWLMRVPPHSAAFDEAQSGDTTHDSRLAEMVAHSPTVSKSDADEDRAWLDELAQRLSKNSATKEPKK